MATKTKVVKKSKSKKRKALGAVFAETNTTVPLVHQITILDTYPEADLGSLATQDADDDLFDDDFSKYDIDPSETEIEEAVEEDNSDKPAKYLPVNAAFNFYCVICDGYHDMLTCKSNGDGNLICPKTHRAIE